MENLVPVNLSVEDVHAAAGIPAEAEEPQAPTAAELDNWAQEAYSLNVSAASSLGFPVGNISESLKRQALMFGASRFKDVAKGAHTYRFGVALRAIIVVSDIQGAGALTLPVVAAKVEIEGARATAQLLVRGYKGAKLADALPAWQSFGVDSYAAYMKAVSEMQKLIMEDEGNIQPELLATTAMSSALPSPAASVGSVYALHAISESATLAHAIDQLPTGDSEVVNTIRAVYRSRLGEEERAAPDPQQQQDAREQLHGLHLSRRWFGS